jgi:hypothetical protein
MQKKAVVPLRAFATCREESRILFPERWRIYISDQSESMGDGTVLYSSLYISKDPKT